MREVIDDDIFDTLFFSNFEIKLLKEEDPKDESGLRVLFKHKISKCEMVGEYDGFGSSRYERKFFNANITAKNSFLAVV